MSDSIEIAKELLKIEKQLSKVLAILDQLKARRAELLVKLGS